MQQLLGGFGDLRLEKGGRSYWRACWLWGRQACGFVRWEAPGLARFGLDASCATVG